MWAGTAHVAASSMLQLFGDNLNELWIAGEGLSLSGTDVLSWKGVKVGLEIPALAARPQFTNDGSYFGSRPVVRVNRAQQQGFGSLVLSTPLGVSTDVVHQFAVLRKTATQPADTSSIHFRLYGVAEGTYWSRSCGNTVFGASSGNPAWSCMQTYCYSGSGDTNHTFLGLSIPESLAPQCVHLCQGDSSTGQGAIIGVNGSANGANGVPAPFGRIAQIRFATRGDLGWYNDASYAAFGIVRHKLGAAEIYALAKLSAAEWGTPAP